ncbi:uncharacterized protein LOC141714513 [Apium graveolens]|uniref:uncharacterized protein LOC141714513 n=1 Tax=Apium graveolens TaxID=4045 RepID=UPI003D797219
MVEGGLYVISNFYTKEASGTLRPTSSKYIINFSNSTTVQRLDEDDFIIPSHKFEFVNLSELFNLTSSYENPEAPPLATDVISVLEDFENVKLIQTQYGERQIVKFRITDGRYSHKVTVWGGLAEAADKMYLEKIKKRPIIVILASTKLRIFKSSVQINTLPSSEIYLNLDNIFQAMRIRLEKEGYKVTENSTASPTQTPNTLIIETVTLKELGKKTAREDINSAVEEGDSWWYLSCIKCKDGKALRNDGNYKCSSCTLVMPVIEKRFKIVVLAGDETEAYNFVMMDRVVTRVIGQTATKLIDDNIMVLN